MGWGNSIPKSIKRCSTLIGKSRKSDNGDYRRFGQWIHWPKSSRQRMALTARLLHNTRMKKMAEPVMEPDR